jgi:ArsR family transcriptional regulator, arsenate/arsenite/antimonite-responsive transcriptional repressor
VPASPTAPAVTDLEDLFKGFADSTRIRILNLLAAGELCVCDITEILRIPQSTISRHLAYLLRSELVEVSQEWRFSHYRLAQPVDPIHKNLIGCVRTCFRGIPSLDRERIKAEERVMARETDPC